MFHPRKHEIYLLTTYCCNLSAGVALNVRFTTNGMCAKNNTIYTWREQAIIEWSWHVNSCCLLPQCEVMRTCRSGFPIAIIASAKYTFKLRIVKSQLTRVSHACSNYCIQPRCCNRWYKLSDVLLNWTGCSQCTNVWKIIKVYIRTEEVSLQFTYGDQAIKSLKSLPLQHW